MRRRSFITLICAAASWPLVGRAQQKGMPVIGLLSGASPGPQAANVAALQEALSETGFVEGKTLAIEYRWAEGVFDRLPALARDLVAQKVDLIAALSPPAALAAKAATSTIPIVFQIGADPVALGLIASLARPGGNITGVSILLTELVPKRLELITEMVPGAKTIALLVNPNGPEAEPEMRTAELAARQKGLLLPILKAGTVQEIDTAFATLTELHADALLVGNDPFYFPRREQLAVLSVRHAIPTIHFLREFVVAGGLFSYGPSITDTYRQVGLYAAKILKGEKPADLPVQQPTKFELVINLKAAKALGLAVPQSLLARADEVIE